MGAKLIGELTDWLLSPAAVGMTPAERCVLFIVAERSNDATRKMWRFKADDQTLYDRVLTASGMTPSGLNKVFQRLAGRGLEVRVKIGAGKDGRPVYSAEKHSIQFALPAFPASVELAERPPPRVATEPAEPVDNPVDNPPRETPGAAERPPSGVATEPSGRLQGSERPPSEAALNPTYPYRDNPYEETPGWTSAGAEVEDGGRGPAEPPAKNDLPQFSYRAACEYLLTIPGDLRDAAHSRALAELGTDAKRELVLIRAAQLALKGIPA